MLKTSLACGSIRKSEEDYVQHICDLFQKESGFSPITKRQKER